MTMTHRRILDNISKLTLFVHFEKASFETFSLYLNVPLNILRKYFLANSDRICFSDDGEKSTLTFIYFILCI